jgi:two-component system, NtrC family, sensor histidine kinase HydH
MKAIHKARTFGRSIFSIRASRTRKEREHDENLLWRFSIVTLLVITLLALTSSLWISGAFTRHMLDREARVTKEFVHNVFEADGSALYLVDPLDASLEAKFRGSVMHFMAVPDVQRINVYGRDRRVIWSSETAMSGMTFEANDDLDRALQGEVVVEKGKVTESGVVKKEHIGLYPQSLYFVEVYIPVVQRGRLDVLGVVEIYKAPKELTEAIDTGRSQIWMGAALGASILYLTLFGMVRRAHQKLVEQQERLRKNETLSAVGELASSMAHNIRSPLSSIRTSAELARDSLGASEEPWPEEIMRSADRIDAWLGELISYSNIEQTHRWMVDACAVLRSAVESVADDCSRRQIRIQSSCNVDAALVKADGHLLAQVLQVLIDNAIEATQPGGLIEASLVVAQSGVEIRVRDTGCGVRDKNMPRLFELFFTTKPSGMGVGLALAKRAVERFGGTIRAESKLGRGTSMIIVLPSQVGG